MATLCELKETLGLRELTDVMDCSREIKDGCVCDLLSWVMARGEEGTAWVTVQTHLNVVAVASLHDFACVVVPENIDVPDATVAKANEEGIPVFSSCDTAYTVCRKMSELGIGK